MMAMTTKSSMRVNARREGRQRVVVVFMNINAPSDLAGNVARKGMI